jgi:hypothetical protein
MENPLLAVPVLLGIVVIVFKLVGLFIGIMGVSKNTKEE